MSKTEASNGIVVTSRFPLDAVPVEPSEAEQQQENLAAAITPGRVAGRDHSDSKQAGELLESVIDTN